MITTDKTLRFEISAEHLKSAQDQVNRQVINETLFVVPNNDGEAKRAVEILTALKAPHFLRSIQPWGATLEREDLLSYLKPGIKRIAIFEIPGLEMEQHLKNQGYEVVIIDHHDYKQLDRRHPESSLEQLMTLINWPANSTDMAVAINDRGYIPGLKAGGYTPEQIQAIREYDLMAQGRNLKDIRNKIEAARALIPSLPRRDGVVILDNVRADEAILKQELANLAPNGITDTFEFRNVKSPKKDYRIGFSGSPEVVEALFRFDFNSLGYESESYEKYRGGDPKASMYFGFKVYYSPEGQSQELPKRVVDRILEMVLDTKKTAKHRN